MLKVFDMFSSVHVCFQCVLSLTDLIETDPVRPAKEVLRQILPIKTRLAKHHLHQDSEVGVKYPQRIILERIQMEATSLLRCQVVTMKMPMHMRILITTMETM